MDKSNFTETGNVIDIIESHSRFVKSYYNYLFLVLRDVVKGKVK